MEDPFKNIKFIWEFYDDINFFPRKEQEEVRKVVERYIKKTKPVIIKSD